MKRVLLIIAITAACLAAGYGLGVAASKIMKNDAKESGYVGQPTVEIKDGVMTPEVLLSYGRLSDPQLSPDGKTILYGVSYISVEDNKSCRNLFAVDVDGTHRRQLTRYASSVSCARWSEDGRSIYFLQGGQLYRAPFKGKSLGKKVQLSNVEAGISEFALGPGETKILYTSTIPGPVKTASDSGLDKANAYVADQLMCRHWDHWVTETPRSFVAPFDGKLSDGAVDLLGDEPYELPTEPFGGIEQLSWSPDGRYIAYSCRKKMGIEYAFSTNSGIYVYDTQTGETVPVKTDGGYDTDPSWSPDGQSLAWISMERDGYEADRQRLLVVGMSEGRPNGQIRELTEGFIYDVSGIAWTADSRELLFPTTIDAIGALCSVAADGSSEVHRLTPAQWWLGLSTPFDVKSDESGLHLLTTAACMKWPTEVISIEVPIEGEGSYQAITHENDHITSALDDITEEQMVLKTAQGEDLYCWVLYPPKFDASKQYPAVEMFNGGPQTSLDQSWSYRWNFRLMAQQGYVVVLPNRHGDSGFGQSWKEQISGDYQGLNMDDYMLAGRWAAEQPWCTGVAGVGASYGGFSVYNMMGIHGDLFKCFISHAGIFDEKAMWYTTEEAWFGNWDNGGLREYAYEPGQVGPKGDGITFGGMQQAGAPYADVAKSQHHYAYDPQSKVTAWHTPILCMHGELDYRIPYEQGLAAFTAAQMMGVPSKLVVFPEECHWVTKPQNALFWHKTFFDWLDQWMK